MTPNLMINTCKNVLAPYVGAHALGRGCFGLDSSIPATLQTLERVGQLLAEAGELPRAPRVLELGPGRTPELLAALVLMGAERGIGIDIEVRVPTDSALAIRYEGLAHALCAPGSAALLESFGTTQHEVSERFEGFRGGSLPIGFIAYGGVHLPLGDEEIDLILSTSVLEHVRLQHVDPLLREMRRVLAVAGTMVHLVDLRDHLHIKGADQVHGDWLEALSISPWRFHLMFSRRSTCINRLRSCEWREALKTNGLTAGSWQEHHFPLPAGFDARALQAPWNSFSPSELAVGQVDFTARRQ